MNKQQYKRQQPQGRPSAKYTGGAQGKPYPKNDKPYKKFDKPRRPSDQTAHQQENKTKPIHKKVSGNEQMPTIQDMLEIKPEERQAKTESLFAKVKPFLASYLQKKQGSRVLQLMFKWGTPEIRTTLHKAMLQNWKDLIKSKYALHAISKVSAEFDFPKLAEDAVLLQNNKEGSLVLENYIVKHPGSKVAQEIVGKFEAIHQQMGDKGVDSQEPLHNLAIKCIEKEYYTNRVSKLVLRLALPTMIAEEQQKVIEFFADKGLDLLADEEGVKLFIQLFNYFDSKQKKNIVKLLKGRVNQLIGMSKMSYVGLIKLLTEIDDTVSVGNKLVPELFENIQSVADKDSPLYHVFISLLSARNNNFNCLGKLERVVSNTTCKKPEETRKKEIREFLYSGLVQYLTQDENIRATCSTANMSRLALGLIKSMQADGQGLLKDFTTKIIKHFIDDMNAHKAEGSKKIEIEKTLMADNFGSKLIKNVLLLKQTHIDKYCDKIAELFKYNLEPVLHSNASFVLTVLIERGRTELSDEIKRQKIDVTKARAADFYLTLLKPKK